MAIRDVIAIFDDIITAMVHVIWLLRGEIPEKELFSTIPHYIF